MLMNLCDFNTVKFRKLSFHLGEFQYFDFFCRKVALLKRVVLLHDILATSSHETLNGLNALFV